MSSLVDKLREILAVELQIEKERVVPSASLRRDLGMDSVAALNILFAAEEAFALAPIDVQEIAQVTTVAEIENLLRRYVGDAES